MLPKIDYAKTIVNLPSTNKQVYLRPMTIRQEKILLTARESGEQIEIMRAIVDILEECVEGSVAVKNMPTYDIEWLFMKLRMISVGSKVELAYTPEGSEKQYPFTIDLEKIEGLKMKTNPSSAEISEIHLDGGLMIKLRHTPITAYFGTNPDDLDTLVVLRSIEYVKSNGERFNPNEVEFALGKQWIEDLPAGVLEKIYAYLATQPTLEHEVEVELEDGTKETVRLASIFDFFTL